MPHTDPSDVHVPTASRGRGADRPDQDFDQAELEAGIRQEMDEHGVDREAAKRLVKDHLAAGEHYRKSGLSREYLEAFHEHAQAQLPGWQTNLIHQAARPSSGGAAGRRRPEHSATEIALLRKLTPEHLGDAKDEELSAMWSELDGHHRLATKKKLPTEDYDRAASFLAQEMSRRKIEFDRTSLLGKSAVEHGTVASRLAMLPAEIPLSPAAGLVRDGEGLGLRFHPLLSDADLVEAALLDVGVHCKSALAEGLESPGLELLYDVVLRRAGAKPPDDGGQLEIAARPHGLEPLMKADAEKRVIWYIIAEPGAKDTYGHVITRDEVEDACHRYMQGPRRVFMEHGEERGLNTDGQFPRDITGKVITVESGLLPCDTNHFFGAPLPRIAPMGSWFGANYHPDEKLWKYLSTNEHGASWRGYAAKEER